MAAPTAPPAAAPYERLRLVRGTGAAAGVLEIVLARPRQLNVMDDAFFAEVGRAAAELEADAALHCAVLWAEGPVFTAGLDLKAAGAGFLGGGGGGGEEEGKEEEETPFTPRIGAAVGIWRLVKKWQKHLAALRECTKPVIAAIHNKCIGGGVDLSCWADVRLCTADATFAIKETQIGIVADMGTLQRIGKIASAGFAREVAFTGEPFNAQRAHEAGLVNTVYDDKASMLEAARAMAQRIAANSLLIVQGTKVSLNYADEHNTEDSLNQIALWNTGFLQSDDLFEAITAFMTKRQPKFRNRL